MPRRAQMGIKHVKLAHHPSTLVADQIKPSQAFTQPRLKNVFRTAHPDRDTHTHASPHGPES